MIGPRTFDIITATKHAGTIHLPAFCFAKVRGPTPTTTYESTNITPTAADSPAKIESNKRTNDSATITVAVSSHALRTKRTTFK